MEEGGANLLFQLADLARHGTLGEVQLFGRARHALVTGGGLKGQQVGGRGQEGSAQQGHTGSCVGGMIGDAKN
ncbi:hypothetical protein D3C72_2469200 [compost metagenome]